MTNKSRGELDPGGLALVIGCKVNPEDIGKTVTLRQRIIKGGYFISPHDGEIVGLNNNSSPIVWLCESPDIVSASGKPGWCLYGENHLMPIKPEADPMDITEQMECKA